MAELMTIRPIFALGSEVEVLNKTFYMLGTPHRGHASMITKLPKYGSQ